MKDYRIAMSESSEELVTFSDKDKITYLGFAKDKKSLVEITDFNGDQGEEFIERSKVLINIKHPHLAIVTSINNEDNKIYSVSEFIDGEDFHSYSKRVHAVPPDQVIKWIIQFLEGIRTLRSRGLSASLESTRLCVTGMGRTRVVIPECAIHKGQSKMHLGDEISQIIKVLTNHQEPSEPMVCPPEIEDLVNLLSQMDRIDAILLELRSADSTGNALLGDAFYPRSFLEREMFQRFRPEHALPASFVGMQRGFFHSNYQSLFEDQSTQETFRVTVVPPERIVPQEVLGLSLRDENSNLIKIKEIDEHNDFCILREVYVTGFSIQEFIERSANRSLDEVIILIQRVHDVLESFDGNPALSESFFESNIIIEFERLGGYGLNSLASVVPLKNWPPFEIKVRQHLTIPTMNIRSHSEIIGDSDELIGRVEQGLGVSAGQIFSWYLYLRRSSLKNAAVSFLERLNKSILPSGYKSSIKEFDVNESTEANEETGMLDTAEDLDQEDGMEPLKVSPIAIALGYNENREDAEDDDKESNPIAKQLNKREEEDAILDFSLLNDDDPIFEEPASPGRRTAVILAIIVMILAIALALFLAHLSGRAFWLQG